MNGWIRHEAKYILLHSSYCVGMSSTNQPTTCDSFHHHHSYNLLPMQSYNSYQVTLTCEGLTKGFVNLIDHIVKNLTTMGSSFILWELVKNIVCAPQISIKLDERKFLYDLPCIASLYVVDCSEDLEIVEEGAFEQQNHRKNMDFWNPMNNLVSPSLNLGGAVSMNL